MRPTPAELLETARLVLSGEMTYEQLCAAGRFRQAYVFVALMLVCREDYLQDSIHLRPKRPLNHTMATFLHEDDVNTCGTLVSRSRELQLHKNNSALGIVLTPPDELRELVASFSPESPGVMAFFRGKNAAEASCLAEYERLDDQAKAERAKQMPIEAAGDALIEDIFAGSTDNPRLAEQILWELYRPAAQEAAARIAEASPDIREYVAAKLVRTANRALF